MDLTPYKVLAGSGGGFRHFLRQLFAEKICLPEGGPFLTGVLGGLYSSTATGSFAGRKDQNSKVTAGAHSLSHLDRYRHDVPAHSGAGFCSTPRWEKTAWLVS